ncbi:hypothetical protein BH24CHL6_BH24CHL6_17310 [soil metagenome]
MPDLSTAERSRLPDSAFAYVDSRGRRLLPIHDEGHVRNALARFSRTNFEDDEARDRARRRLLKAARKYAIVPDGFIAGQLEPHRRLPSGAVTFLLADVESSTELLAGMGEHYGALLADLRRLMRRHVRRHGGREVDARGDEYFAAFERPTSAVRAAVDIQLAVARLKWPNGAQPRLRMGIHSGRPTLTNQGYVGLAVHAVARVCSAGHGGQVILSRATVSALGKELPAGMHLSSLGEHRLRGLAQPMELFQLHAPELRADFPSLRVQGCSAPGLSRTGGFGQWIGAVHDRCHLPASIGSFGEGSLGCCVRGLGVSWVALLRRRPATRLPSDGSSLPSVLLGFAALGGQPDYVIAVIVRGGRPRRIGLLSEGGKTSLETRDATSRGGRYREGALQVRGPPLEFPLNLHQVVQKFEQGLFHRPTFGGSGFKQQHNSSATAHPASLTLPGQGEARA